METLTLAAFCTGATALAKKLGISGDWLILVCIVAGGVYTYLTTYQPALWHSLSGVLMAGTTSGNVALVQDLISLARRPAGA